MKILVVDDMEVNRKLLGANLEAEGHTVVEACDGVEALKVLKHGPIDAIISDILMPRMDGYRLCYEVRSSARLRRLPFIFHSSSYTSQSDADLALEMGGDCFLAKPAPTAEIIDALRQATSTPRRRLAPAAPSFNLNLMKEYNQQLVAKLEQKNAELSARNEELLRSEEKLLLLDAALETAANPMMITDAGGTILWINPAFTAQTGYSQQEVIGRKPSILNSGQHDMAFYRHLWGTILAGDTWRGNFTNRRKDGSLYQDEHTITPVRGKDGKVSHFIAIMHDVSERLQVQEQLRWKSAMFEAHVNSSLDGVLIVDDKGKKVMQNQRMLDLWRIPPEFANDPENQREFEWVTTQMKEPGEFAERVAYLYAHPDQVSQDELEMKDGRVLDRWTAPVRGKDGVHYGRIWTFRDVTERKRSAAQIAEQADFLDKARDAILVSDLDGKVLFWNKGAERMYGWARHEAIGKNVSTIFYRDPKIFEEKNELTLRNGEWSGEMQHLTRDKHEMTVEARWTLVRDAERRPKAVLSINTDITEKKKIEAQFMRTQRMESIGTLAGGIAHDLNNILTPIMMSIGIMKTMTDNAKIIEILNTIEQSARRGSQIVRQVLSFARGVEGERIEVQPKHLIKELSNIIKDTFPKDVCLNFSVPNDIWTILCDPTQVHQILLNLCVNARDAMPHGGTLSVKVENVALDEQYAAMNIQAKPGRYVRFSVSDTGTGIAPELLEKIFEPFFTTKGVTQGTGLGLSTVMAIVKSHEGSINVYSEAGKGTTFRVDLPAMEGAGSEGRAKVEIADLPRGNGETILIVDDEASILTITGQTLQAFGYRVLSATDGADAMAKYAQHQKEIAAVLTDMRMPIMDGTATIHALLRLDPAVKIIGASGFNSGGTLGAAKSAGVRQFLTKPYTPATLLKAVRAVLDES